MADNRNLKEIPFVAHEAAMSRADRANKRLLIVIAMLIIACLLDNIGWAVFHYNAAHRNEAPAALIVDEAGG